MPACFTVAGNPLYNRGVVYTNDLSANARSPLLLAHGDDKGRHHYAMSSEK